ncbi:efflux RND transporter periplasmic adaptor subunit [Salinimicrobium sp. GXAS 041]|uniref:efflux RND transporter periplasmic adaptor subunit n=1 Tax=Salinimicrobium sp. GXAS 041 TaxID=3400806 RepID=UPI003C766183
MKKLSYLIIVLLTVYSCGKSESVEDVIQEGNASDIRAKKAELSSQQSEINAKIAKLDEALAKMDVSNRYALVNTKQLGDTLFKHYVELPGDVDTDQNIIIYPEYSGVLTNVLVEEGQEVQKGQILARIDAGGLESQLAQMEAQAALAKTTFERQERLWEQQIGSEIQYLEAQTNYEALQNSVSQLKSQLAKTVVRAPFSGTIDEIFTDQGEVVGPGQNRLFRLVNLSNMYITASVPESYLGDIRVGTGVIVEIGATGIEFESEVRQVANFINPNNRTFEIKVAVPDEVNQVKPNQIATVKINDYTSENAVIIPESVVQQNAAGENVAFVVERTTDSTGIARRRVIETGYNYEEKIEVLEGIKSNEIIIIDGARNVRDGEEVKIRG